MKKADAWFAVRIYTDDESLTDVKAIAALCNEFKKSTGKHCNSCFWYKIDHENTQNNKNVPPPSRKVLRYYEVLALNLNEYGQEVLKDLGYTVFEFSITRESRRRMYINLNDGSKYFVTTGDG